MKFKPFIARRFRYFTLLHLDHYHALGVDRNASPETIEAAYSALLTEVSRDAYARFTALLMGQSPARLQRARDVLLNVELRSAYDSHLDWLYHMHGNARF